jgi:hypothetical protein
MSEYTIKPPIPFRLAGFMPYNGEPPEPPNLIRSGSLLSIFSPQSNKSQDFLGDLPQG